MRKHKFCDITVDLKFNSIATLISNFNKVIETNKYQKINSNN